MRRPCPDLRHEGKPVPNPTRGPTAASGFTIINTPDVLAAAQAAKTSNPVSIYSAYVSGVGSIALNTVQPMRIVEIGLIFRF